MAKTTGFLDYQRQDPPKRKPAERVKDFGEIEQLLAVGQLEIQAARCMDCGIPTCHVYGCPLSNYIPDWNDMVFKKKWRKALALLHRTNNFPEITGRICPAPCETSCTLYINQEPVTIRQIELQIVEMGWRRGWIKPEPARMKTGRKVAIIGSGPAGLTAAQQLCRLGHRVTVYEKSDRVGGILRYGIPDYKLPKNFLDRRIEQIVAEGVVFATNTEVGKHMPVKELCERNDAVLIANGAGVPRDLEVPGRELRGVHFAMDFLTQQNKLSAGDKIPNTQLISAAGRQVVVVGGGDTGSDCIGTSLRQGAAHVTQLELLPQPPENYNPDTPWPYWPVILRTSTSHEEGCERMFAVNTKALQGRDNRVTSLSAVRLDWKKDNAGKWTFSEIPGSEFELKAELVLLAMGFLHVQQDSFVEDLGLALNAQRNIQVDTNYQSSRRGVFAAGDAETGASLVVRAIDRGRKAAACVHNYLQ